MSYKNIIFYAKYNNYFKLFFDFIKKIAKMNVKFHEC